MTSRPTTPTRDGRRTLESVLPEVGQVIPRVYNRSFRELDVSTNHAFALEYVGAHGPLTQTDLATSLALGKATTGDLVRQMEQRAHVERAPDPNDGRAQLVRLADEGRAILEDLRPIWRDIAERTREGTTAAEQRLVIDVLFRLRRNITVLAATEDLPTPSPSPGLAGMPIAPAPAQSWRSSIEFQLPQIGRMMQRLYSGVLESFDIGHRQAIALAYLAPIDIPQVHLSRLLGLGGAATGSLVEGMEQAGLVSRRSDPTDQRVRIVSLSTTGSELVEQFKPGWGIVATKIRTDISRAERQLVGDVLVRMRDNLDRLEASPLDVRIHAATTHA